MSETYYQILELAELTKSPEAIKQAYRRQAQRWHPDRHAGQIGSVERFQNIQHAYQILSDVAKKIIYDQELLQQRQEQQVKFETTEVHPEPAPDWLDTLKSKWQKPRHEWDKNGPGGYHVHLSLKLGWKEAFSGTRRLIKARVAEVCASCRGHDRLCQQCSGTGQVFYNKTFMIDIPRGSIQGEVLRLFGQGHNGPRTSEAGDILIKLKFDLPYPWQLLEGTLIRPLILSPQQAHKGGDFELKSLQGTTGKIHLPGLLENGQKVRLLRQGWAEKDRGVKDAFLVISIKK